MGFLDYVNEYIDNVDEDTIKNDNKIVETASKVIIKKKIVPVKKVSVIKPKTIGEHQIIMNHATQILDGINEDVDITMLKSKPTEKDKCVHEITSHASDLL